jgi:hypothetical protein
MARVTPSPNGRGWAAIDVPSTVSVSNAVADLEIGDTAGLETCATTRLG